MPLITCDHCGKEFKKKASHIAAVNNNYCSINCAAEGRKTGKVILCYVCGKETYKQRKDIKKNQSCKFFCGMKCSMKWRNSLQSGVNHPNWKGGEFVYKEKLKKQKNISQECVRCGKDDTRILVAHHIDESRKNNEISNLVWLCHNCHHLVHRYKKEKKKFLRRIT